MYVPINIELSACNYLCMSILLYYSPVKEGSVKESPVEKGGNLEQQIQKAVDTLESDLLIEDTSVDVKLRSFLLVIQTLQQQKWLNTYGNVVTCMDAIYKSNKYAFPCFFVVVKTSIGIGRVVGTIIPQFETTEMICEGLKML